MMLKFLHGRPSRNALGEYLAEQPPPQARTLLGGTASDISVGGTAAVPRVLSMVISED
jgi:hypothetical protein